MLFRLGIHFGVSTCSTRISPIRLIARVKSLKMHGRYHVSFVRYSKRLNSVITSLVSEWRICYIRERDRREF